MKREYTIVQPEVIVGLGDHTTDDLDKQDHITHLHIHLEDWLGDDLMEIYPCYLVTEQLKVSLENSEFTGFSFNDMELSLDEYFDNNYQLDKDLPKFWWLKVNGEKGKDDLFLSEQELFISQPLLDFLMRNFELKYAKINPEKDELDDFLNDLFK